MINVFIIISVIILFIYAISQVNKKYIEEEKKPLKKYEIPYTFWEDYNKCLFAIRDMKMNNINQVETKIDELTYKYVELVEYDVFVEKISNLVSLYNNQVKYFLLNKHLN